LISYYYRQSEKYYDEYRQLNISYIENNIDEYLIFIADEDLNDPNISIYSKEITLNKKMEYILKCTKNAKRNGFHKISTAGILFNADIRLYILNNNIYIDDMNLLKNIIKIK